MTSHDVFPPAEPLAELHTHLGGSVPTHILWEIAHQTGVATGVSDYWAFEAKVSVPDAGVDGLDPLDDIYGLCERIQSSPDAVERAVHALISGGYRKQRITTVEVRFNPAKRNRSAEIDLDHVVLAACRAVDRASIEYPAVRAGVVLMCDRTFSVELNEVIVAKALRWRDRGVVGIDLGGPRPHPGRYDYSVHAPAFAEARAAGLGVTVHCGEDGDPTEIADVVESLRPHRIGHGVLAHRDEAVLGAVVDAGVVFEWCPTSNLRTGVFDSVARSRRRVPLDDRRRRPVHGLHRRPRDDAHPAPRRVRAAGRRRRARRSLGPRREPARPRRQLRPTPPLIA